MLLEGRLDVILDYRILATITTEKFDVPFYYSKPLVSTLYYHYLHKKNAALVLQLGEALQSMLRDGSYRRMLGRFIDRYPE